MPVESEGFDEEVRMRDGRIVGWGGMTFICKLRVILEGYPLMASAKWNIISPSKILNIQLIPIIFLTHTNNLYISGKWASQ